ncbi:MAG TPA: aminoacetone oxidase family FAD-binding enzyme, partial [Dissulfurispiraceae bacterium]|nr:aminoacetone oxidase family FAD-binding enzyme [Dissulfurispiraceae bacterium]
MNPPSAPARSDVIILGAGASGLMCAVEAAKRGRSVLMLDHASRAGKKILVSGGGHCNFTNLQMSPDHFLSDNPHFCKSALARFQPSAFLAFLDQHGVRHYEKSDGQMFCRSSAAEIVRILQEACISAGVEFKLGCTVQMAEQQNGFSVVTGTGLFTAPSLVVATGGISYPALGATDIGYRIARQFGLQIIQPSPALVPLLFSRSDRTRFSGLSGLSVQAGVTCGGRSFVEQILFTHAGLSGPAILQASSYWQAGKPLVVDLLPGQDAAGLIEPHRIGKAEVVNVLSRFLPRRFCRQWCRPDLATRPMKTLNDKEINDLADSLHHWIVIPAGT